MEYSFNVEVLDIVKEKNGTWSVIVETSWAKEEVAKQTWKKEGYPSFNDAVEGGIHVISGIRLSMEKTMGNA